MTGWSLGDITITRVLECEGPLLPPTTLYPKIESATLTSNRAWLEPRHIDPETGHVVIAFHSFVIDTPRARILVDTCGGNDKPRPQKPRYHMRQHPYLANLAAAGVAPESVDVVLCTHLHVDHVGWNTRLIDGRWVPTFPNARYLFARAEWEFWQAEYKKPTFTDDPFYEDSVLPVIAAGQADFVDGDLEIAAGITLEPTPGHTPGHIAIHVEGGGRHAVMSGDLMHNAVQCAVPELSSCFCVDPALSARTRRAFLERYAETPSLIMPAHFPTPGAGFVRPAGDAFRFALDGEE